MKCFFYNKEHCNYKNVCQDDDPKDDCQERNCQRLNCERRHPKHCRKYFLKGSTGLEIGAVTVTNITVKLVPT